MSSILIVSYHFPPDCAVGAKRALRIACFLSSFGWEIEVLTVKEGYFDHLDPTLLAGAPPFRVIRTSAFEPKPILRALRARLRPRAQVGGPEAAPPGSPDGAEAARGPFLSRAWDAVFSCPDEWGGWMPWALPAGLFRARRPDLILATLPVFTNAVLGALLSRALRVALVLDYRDPWSAAARRSGLPLWRRRLDQRIERFCLKQASLVVATTGSIAEEVCAHGAPPCVVVPNAFDRRQTDPIEPAAYDRFNIVYAGTFYESRTAGPILEAMRLLRSRDALPRQGLTLRVLGASGAEVRTLAERMEVSDLVEDEGFLPYAGALSRMKGADLLLLVVGEGHATQIPAKLYDYLAARRFILALAPPRSEAARLVEDLGVGRVVAPGDIEGIARLLAERFVAPRALFPLGAVLRFEARATMQDLDGHLRRLLSGRSSGPEESRTRP